MSGDTDDIRELFRKLETFEPVSDPVMLVGAADNSLGVRFRVMVFHRIVMINLESETFRNFEEDVSGGKVRHVVEPFIVPRVVGFPSGVARRIGNKWFKFGILESFPHLHPFAVDEDAGDIVEAVGCVSVFVGSESPRSSAMEAIVGIPSFLHSLEVPAAEEEGGFPVSMRNCMRHQNGSNGHSDPHFRLMLFYVK